MGKSFDVVFVSNYINHHQIPFCNAMSRILQGNFTFIQTEPMEADRVKMGWHQGEKPEYVKLYYEEKELCEKLILECAILLFGGTDEESYISGRLRTDRPIIRISERLYKRGQWRAVSPRGLRKKYRDHTSLRRRPVYLLCAGAYVASDFHIVRAYPGKMFCWGYFPQTMHYNVEKLLQDKGYRRQEETENVDVPVLPYLLWAGRMIDWKHPELAVETARNLKEKGFSFHMDMVGDGDLRQEMEKLAENYGLQEHIRFLGYQPPETVRRYMEKADIFLFTSDRQEGWGAVANEAMNSGCVLIAGHSIGAVPFLVNNGENGFLFEEGSREQLFALTEQLVKDREGRRKIGRKAYETITEVWNAENAAERLTGLMREILQTGDRAGTKYKGISAGAYSRNLLQCEPCTGAPILGERNVKRLVRAKWKKRRPKQME